MLSLRYKTTLAIASSTVMLLWIAFKIYVIFEIQNNYTLSYSYSRTVVNRFQNLCYLWDTKQQCKPNGAFVGSCESLSKFMLSLRYKTTHCIYKSRAEVLWIAFKIYVIFEIQNNIYGTNKILNSVVNRFQNLCYLWDTKQPA